MALQHRNVNVAQQGTNMSIHIPRVSIGVPVYNGEQLIGAALDSLLAQTFEDFELIISDNASTDATEEICRAYAAKDRRIRYYRNERNIGVARNFNRVFELSRGQYFKWHSHDDMCAPTMVERCVEVLDQMPSVILCYARSTIIDEHGTTIQYHFEDCNLRSPSPYQRYKHYHYHNPRCRSCCAYYGLIRRSVLAQTPLMMPFIYSDANLLGELALRGEFYEVPEYLFWRRHHPSMATYAAPTSYDHWLLYEPEKQRKALSSYPKWRRGYEQARSMIRAGWRMCYEQVRSVTRVPMNGYDKARCYLLAGRYFGAMAQRAFRKANMNVRQRVNYVRKPSNSGNTGSHHRSV